MIAPLMRHLHKPIYDSRVRVLTKLVASHLVAADRVLDVGCGRGQLARAILESPDCPTGVRITGLELNKFESEVISVEQYGGSRIPYPDDSVDVVILADVLHHAEDPHRLISECVRISRRMLLIKDHKLDGPLAQQRVALLDWAANKPYGNRCLYRYCAIGRWRQWHRRHGLSIEHELCTMHLYPPIVNLLFGRRLQYWAALAVPSAPSDYAAASDN